MFRIVINEETRHLQLEVGEESASEGCLEIQGAEEEDLVKSKRIRARLKRIAWAIYRAFREEIRIHIRAILHNTTHTENEVRQIIERYTRKIPFGTPFQDRVNLFMKLAQENPEEFARDILRIEQHAVDLDAQLLGMSIIVGEKFTEDSRPHKLKGLILRCANPFLDSLNEQGVRIEFKDMDSATAALDFRLFNCAMYHFFDNMKKYIKPDSWVTVSISGKGENLDFEMISRAIESSETSRIFHESFSGRHAGGQKGEGFGMYIFYQVLVRLEAIPEVLVPKDQVRIDFEGNLYQKNIFRIRFPSGKISAL